MIRKRFAPIACAALAALVLAGAGVVGLGSALPAAAQQATPTATPVTTGNIPVIALNPAICFTLVAAKFLSQGAAIAATKGGECDTIDSSAPTQSGTSTQGHDSLMDLEKIIGNGDGVLQPSDFTGIDLDGNMVHNGDPSGYNTWNGNLLIIAFPNAQGPVRFVTNSGVFLPPVGSGNNDTAGQIYVCDSQAGAGAPGPFVEDTDCAASSEAADDHVVVARLGANFGSTVAPRGLGTVTINQGQTDSATIGFRVVGEPWTVSFVTLKTTIQDGLTPDQCPLPGNASGFLGANGTAEKAIVLATVKDIDGTPITGALVDFNSPDLTKAIFAIAGTPTIDLGAFGFGAPNIVCGQTNPGAITFTGNVDTTIASLAVLDPSANTGINTKVDFTVVGVPASMTLTAAPASITCDGTQTSTVTATIVDAAGNPVAAGTKVHFSAQVVGTANPIDATTDDKGVATSVISPLAGTSTGVPVTVTTGTVAQQILVSCTAGGGATPPPSGSGTPIPGGGSGTGGTGTGITGPNTGTGPATAGSAINAILMVALTAFGLLAGSALVWTGTRIRRR